MRPLRALVIYLVAVFIGGPLLAPWLWRLAQFAAPVWPALAHAPFHRFVDRSFLIIALAGLWPLLKALGATSRREIGLVSPFGQFKRLGGGLLLGFASLAIVALLVLGSHERVWVANLAAGKIFRTVLGAAGTAVLVATLEEILFRGGVFGGLRRIMPWTTALGISSAIYALVHFLQRTELTGSVHWNSGLILLPQMLAGFFDRHQLVPGFLNLTLAGILLGLAYQRTGNLYFSIGLHAGWIFWLKTYGALTVAMSPNVSWFWGTGKLIDGWLAFLVLAGILAVFKFLPLEPVRKPPTFP
jgi:membrane protease YdiL (CAAX protease family)